MLCQECPKKESCVELCEKAEKWVNKDHVSQRELTFPQVTDGERGKVRLNLLLDLADFHSAFKHSELSSFFNESKVDFPFLTPLQNKCLHLFYFQGLTYKQIAHQLTYSERIGYGRTNFSQTQVKYRLKRAKQLIRAHLFKNTGGRI